MTPAAEWDRCKPWLEELFETSPFYTLEYAEQQIAAGEMHFWTSPNCVALTEFTNYPKCRVLQVFAVAGATGHAMREIRSAIEPALCAFAAAHGCKYIRGDGIWENWRPVAERMGYRHLQTVMVKDTCTMN